MPVALQSLIIQCAALLLTALAYRLSLLPFDPTALWQTVLLQGALAAGLSAAWQQRTWWLPLHFGFAPALWLALQTEIPPGLYLAAFVGLLLVYWSSFRTQVPLYLSGRPVWDAVAGLLPADRPFRFVDLGSGVGGLPLNLASRFRQGQFLGVEVAPAPWLISRFRAMLAAAPVQFRRQDYGTLDLGDFDVVFAFLSPAAMPGLWQQAQSQMKPGSTFVSLAFTVASHAPDQIIEASGGRRHALHVWKM
jgi:SAM-dependent methyltransferase